MIWSTYRITSHHCPRGWILSHWEVFKNIPYVYFMIAILVMQAFLGCNEKIFSFDSAVIDLGFNSFTNFTFISINPCSINISISFADCMLDSFSYLSLVTEKSCWNLPETQTQPWNWWKPTSTRYQDRIGAFQSHCLISMLEHSNSFCLKKSVFFEFLTFRRLEFYDLGTHLTQDLECKGDLFKYWFNNAAFHQEDLFRKGKFYDSTLRIYCI